MAQLNNKWEDNSFRKKKSEELRRRAMGNSGLEYLNADAKPYKPKVGKSIARIMDATWPAATHYGFNVKLHYEIGVNKATVLCLRNLNQVCPICEEVDKARLNRDVEFATKYVSKPRVLVYLIDREDAEAGPQVWPMPKTVDTDLALASEDEASKEMVFIDDPNEGYDIVIVKTVPGGVLRNTNYNVKLAKHSSKLSDDEKLMKSWLKQTVDHPIPSLLKYESAEHIKEMIGGGQEPEEEAEVTSEVSTKHQIIDDNEDPTTEETSAAKVNISEAVVMKMKRKELLTLISTHELSVDTDNYESTTDLAEAVCLELGLV